MSERLTLEQFRTKFPEKAKKQLYQLQGGCCGSLLEYDCDTNDTVHNVVFYHSCPGNSTGVAKLVEGMPILEVIHRLERIDCKRRGTSCPDQLAQALKQYLKNRESSKSEG